MLFKGSCSQVCSRRSFSGPLQLGELSLIGVPSQGSVVSVAISSTPNRSATGCSRQRGEADTITTRCPCWRCHSRRVRASGLSRCQIALHRCVFNSAWRWGRARTCIAGVSNRCRTACLNKAVLSRPLFHSISAGNKRRPSFIRPKGERTRLCRISKQSPSSRVPSKSKAAIGRFMAVGGRRCICGRSSCSTKALPPRCHGRSSRAAARCLVRAAASCAGPRSPARFAAQQIG